MTVWCLFNDDSGAYYGSKSLLGIFLFEEMAEDARSEYLELSKEAGVFQRESNLVIEPWEIGRINPEEISGLHYVIAQNNRPRTGFSFLPDGLRSEVSSALVLDSGVLYENFNEDLSLQNLPEVSEVYTHEWVDGTIENFYPSGDSEC